MTILAADGDAVALQRLLRLLHGIAPDAQIHSCTSGDGLLTLQATEGCDVAFLEVELDGLDGIQTAHRLRAAHPHVNIIFTTAREDTLAAAFAMHASGYIVKPVTEEAVRRELSDLRYPAPVLRRLRICTFGHFEVLCDGAPLTFRYRKTKELLAYLVDRKGAMCSARELTAVLFEDDADHRAYYQRLRADLLDTLAAVGFAHAVAQSRGMLAVVPEAIACDYYDYLDGRTELCRLYHGEYMAQYSFAESTNAELFVKANR